MKEQGSYDKLGTVLVVPGRELALWLAFFELEARNDLLAGEFAEIALVEIDVGLDLGRFEEWLSAADLTALLQWLVAASILQA